MKKRATGNMLIAQSGGPSMVINQSLVGAVLEARRTRRREDLRRAARHQGHSGGGFHRPGPGIANARWRPSPRHLPSALGTVRKKPTADDCRRIFEVLQKYDVRYFFYIGGNDSAETAHIINERRARPDYELRCFHIPKTIDNDLRENDHTPGLRERREVRGLRRDGRQPGQPRAARA